MHQHQSSLLSRPGRDGAGGVGVGMKLRVTSGVLVDWMEYSSVQIARPVPMSLVEGGGGGGGGVFLSVITSPI